MAQCRPNFMSIFLLIILGKVGLSGLYVKYRKCVGNRCTSSFFGLEQLEQKSYSKGLHAYFPLCLHLRSVASLAAKWKTKVE